MSTATQREGQGSEARLTNLDHLRAEIERIDRVLVGLIRERVRVARAVGRLKRAVGLPTLDPAQEAVVIGRSAELARASGLPEDDIRDVFWRLVALARNAESELPHRSPSPEGRGGQGARTTGRGEGVSG